MSEKDRKISWGEFYKKITNDIDENLCVKFRCGIEAHLRSYVKKKYPNAISDNNGQILIDNELVTEDFTKEYLKKTEGDYSAREIATYALSHSAMPPIETMSPKSLEKLILSLFNTDEYKRKVYIKRVQGGRNVYCVDFNTAQIIAYDSSVRRLIHKQIKKAEKEADHTSIEWKRYEEEKSYVGFLEEMQDMHRPDQGEYISGLSLQDKSLCMIQELFSLFFTDIGFDLLSNDVAEHSRLETGEDFGERYQELREIFKTPHFGWRYYKTKEIEDTVLDRLAEKIAVKINQMNKKEG